MYICTSRLFPTAHTLPHPCERSTEGHTQLTKALADRRPRLKNQQELNTATWLPLVSGICPFVIEATSSECECIF